MGTLRRTTLPPTRAVISESLSISEGLPGRTELPGPFAQSRNEDILEILRTSNPPNASSSRGRDTDTFNRVLIDRRASNSRVFGTYTIRPLPESGGEFHHLMDVLLILGGHSTFSRIALYIYFDVGKVVNVLADHESKSTDVEVTKNTQTVIDRTREMDVRVGVDHYASAEIGFKNQRQRQMQTNHSVKFHTSTAPGVTCTGVNCTTAAWHIEEDQVGTGLLSKYHLQVVVDSKPLLFGYKFRGNVDEFEKSQARCLHNSGVHLDIPP